MKLHKMHQPDCRSRDIRETEELDPARGCRDLGREGFATRIVDWTNVCPEHTWHHPLEDDWRKDPYND